MVIDYDDIDYEVDDNEVIDLIASVYVEEILDTRSVSKELKDFCKLAISSFIKESDVDMRNIIEHYDNDIKSYFRKEVIRNYRESEYETNHPYAYRGLNERNFH